VSGQPFAAGLVEQVMALLECPRLALAAFLPLCLLFVHRTFGIGLLYH
jgi:hypothetical protein